MARYRKFRYIIVTEEEDGRMDAYGPWYDNETAEAYAIRLRDLSPHYNIDADGIHFVRVAVLSLDQWPGIKAFQ